jgi:putative membrane-bound dehydrogenase-like protein
MVHSDHRSQAVLAKNTPRRFVKRLGVLLFLFGLTACSSPQTTVPLLTFTATQPAPSFTATLAAPPNPTSTSQPITTATMMPTVTPVPSVPTDTVVELGTLPPGFSLTIYANLYRPTSLAFGPDGRLYAASADGKIYALADNDGDRRAETVTIYASNFSIPLGLLWIGDDLYISYTNNVDLVQDTDGNGVSDKRVSVVANIPTGLHQNDGMVLGADGYIYMGNGSTCDACVEGSQYSAAILRFKPNGTDLSVVASGLRNPYDVAFNAAGDLFATDNGRDQLGDDLPPEELNHIKLGGFYGWPSCWEESLTSNAGAIPTLAPNCVNQTHAVARFTAHSSANGLTIYNGTNFPAEYQDNAFVAVLGSYNLIQIERGVQRVQLTKVGDTYTSQAEWFLNLGTGGRPLDVTVGPDGGLYVGDYETGQVYRIVYGAP